jgi:hypothetical protein
MSDFTQNQEIWQWLDAHWEEFADYWQSKMKDVSSVELISYDQNKVKGVLASFRWQGVNKVVTVTPQSLIEGLAQLNEDLRERCEEAAEAAENAATYANQKGDYALSEGHRVNALITEITALKAQVKQQGDTAQAQGAAADTLRQQISNWYSQFKSSAESWLSDIVPQWNAFWKAASNAFEQWTAAENDRKSKEIIRQQNEAVRYDNESARSASESERQAAESLRDAAEQQRIIHEEIRLDGTFRQNANTGNWERLNQRTNEWEDSGNSWQGGLLAYRFYTDWSSGRIHVVKNSLDKVNFSIRKGRLVATYNN